MKYLILLTILLVGCTQTDSAGHKYMKFSTICIYGNTYLVGSYNHPSGPVYNNDGSLIPCNKTHGTIDVVVD